MTNDAQSHRTLRLPALPAGWNDLTPEQLEKVVRLNTCGRKSARLEIFLYLTGLKAVGAEEDKEGTLYILRRRGWKHLGERIPLRSWQIAQWIHDCLGWLDRPDTLTRAPYKEVKVGRDTYRMPGDVMVDATFEQYLCAQNVLARYTQTMDRIRKFLEGDSKGRNTDAKELRRLTREEAEWRTLFVSCLLSKGYEKTYTVVDGSRLSTGREMVYPFRKEQLDTNPRRLSKVSRRMFPVMVQHFQSVQAFYAKSYPTLYGPGKKQTSTNPMLIEEGMVNGVMKYQGFASYDEIYRAPAHKILGIMENMCKEAKAIEEANARMKMHKR
jgi:hypothetical protein